MSLTMGTLVERMVADTNLTETQVREALKGFVGVLQTDLSTVGNSVTVTGLGTFKAVQKGNRTARNPKTGEQTFVEPYVKVTFNSSNMLSDRTNGRR